LYPIDDCGIIWYTEDNRRCAAMPTTKAQQRAVNKYMKENYDEIKVRTEKGQKDRIKAHAESRGESVNAFINRAISETMERETAE
jgi:hypothetical protein